MKKLLSCLVSVGVLASTMTAFAASSVFNPNKDPNGDGNLTIADSPFISQYLAGQFEVSDLTQLDMDDNDVVSAVDEVYVRMYDAGMLSSTERTAEPANISNTSTSRNYRVYNAQTGAYKRNYSLTVDNFDNSSNTRDIIGENNQFPDYSEVGVAKILSNDSIHGYLGTGFVVGPHTIATAAHVVFDTASNNPSDLNGIMLFNEYGSPCSFTPVEIHVPLTYVQAYSHTNINDYALVTVTEDMSDYMTLNLGVITNSAVTNNLPISVVGFPGSSNGMLNNNLFHRKEMSEGIVLNNINGLTSNNMNIFAHDADTYEGNSGSPIYVIENVNGITYHTVIGIHIAGTPTYNIGLRFTPHNLKFYNNNANIQY